LVPVEILSLSSSVHPELLPGKPSFLSSNYALAFPCDNTAGA
jgi:hypothetical protein